MKNTKKLYLSLFLAGVLLVGIGAVVTWWEWTSLDVLHEEEMADALHFKTIEKTVQMDPDKAIYLEPYYGHTYIQTDSSLKDGEIHIKMRHDPHINHVQFSTEQNRIDIHYQASDNDLAGVAYVLQDAGKMLKNNQLPTSYQAVLLHLSMNQHTMDQFHENSSTNHQGSYESGVIGQQDLTLQGETIQQKIFEDGTVKFIYPNGREKVLILPDSIGEASTIAETPH